MPQYKWEIYNLYYKLRYSYDIRRSDYTVNSFYFFFLCFSNDRNH